MNTVNNMTGLTAFVDGATQDVSVRGYKVFGQNGKVVAQMHRQIDQQSFLNLRDRAVAISAGIMNVTPADLMSDIRESEMVFARWLVFYYLGVVKGYPTTLVGKALNRNHATVIYGVGQVKLCKENPHRNLVLFNAMKRFEQEISKIWRTGRK